MDSGPAATRRPGMTERWNPEFDLAQAGICAKRCKRPPPLTPPRHSLREWGEGNLEARAHSPRKRGEVTHPVFSRIAPRIVTVLPARWRGCDTEHDPENACPALDAGWE